MMMLLVTALLLSTALAQNPRDAIVDPPLDPQSKKVLERGQRIAVAVSTVTSTAVSPLLGVCVLGAYEYFRTAPEARAKLPAYSKPYFWTSVLALLALIFFKDSIGSHMPLMKKPLDAAEILLVNKASLLLIAFPVVFHEVARMLGFDSLAQIFAALGAWEPVVYAQDNLAHKAGEGGMAILLVIAGLIMATAVWLVSHAIDVLLLLNPFPMIDLMVKGIRTVLFLVLAGLSLYDPRLSGILSAFLVLFSLLIMGWTFRLAVFGAVFSSDLIRTFLFGSYHTPEDGETLLGFAARKWNGIPKRGLIHIRRQAGQATITYRPFLVGARRELSQSASAFSVGRGLFYPLLVDKNNRSVIWLLPRYRKQEDAVARVLGAAGPLDLRFGRGWQAFLKWIKDDPGTVTV